MAVDPSSFSNQSRRGAFQNTAAAVYRSGDLPRPELLQRGIYRSKLGVEFGAKAIDDGDDREADAGSNQPVLYSCSPGLVGQKCANEPFHDGILRRKH